MASVVSTLTGIGGAAHNRGVEWQAQGANVLNPTTTAQANQAYSNTQGALGLQNQMIGALQAQHGVQNQMDVYQQLQNQANGTGPNPAQAMLNNSTGQNVANQAALMAGQRGSSANAGLMARQAAMAGSNAQQQAAGQGAALQAQQSQNALGAMGNLATQQVTQQQNAQNTYANTALQQQQNLLGGIAGQNNANVGMTSNMNSANGQLNGGIATGQGNFLGQITGAAGAAMGAAGGGQVAAKPTEMWSGNMMAEGGQVNPFQNWNGNIMGGGASQAPASNQVGSQLGTALGKTIKNAFADKSSSGGDMSGPTGMVAQPYAFAQGGTVGPRSRVGAMFAEGGNIDVSTMPVEESKADPTGVSTMPQIPKAAPKAPQQAPSTMVGGSAGIGSAFAQGGSVQAWVSPGETYLDPKEVSKVAKGANPLKVGERIPGKPKVAGNSYTNDTVPKDLKEGGIVIPNSIMQSKDPANNAAKFVAAILAKKGQGLR